MNDQATMHRRSFLRSMLGGGLAIAFGTQAGSTALLSRQNVQDSSQFVPELWVTLAPSGEVTIVAHRSEMGTGIATALPMVVADEMEADWDRVSIQQAPGDARYGD